MRSLQLDIAGLSISVRTDRSDEDVQAVSMLVNRHIRNATGSTRAVPNVQQLLVVALTLAQELLDTRSQLNIANEALEEATQALEATLTTLPDVD